MKQSTLLLFVAAPMPVLFFWLLPNVHYSVEIGSLLGALWTAATIVNYRRQRSRQAAWLLALTPLALGVLLFLLLVLLGAFIGYGH